MARVSTFFAPKKDSVSTLQLLKKKMARVSKFSAPKNDLLIFRGIGPVVQTRTRDKNEIVDRQNLQLQDDSGNTVGVTLWGEHANVLKQQTMLNSSPNIVIVLAGMIVKTFQKKPNLSSCSTTKIYRDLPIIDTKLLKRKFEAQPIFPQPLNDQGQTHRTISDDMNENRVTINQLMNIDMLKSKDTHFTCRAKIVEVDETDGWFYNSCNECAKGVRFIHGKYCCPNHGDQTPKPTYKLSITVEDSTGEIDFIVFGPAAEELMNKTIPQLAGSEQLDKMVLPACVKALIKQERIFKINLTKQAINTGVPMFAVSRSSVVGHEQILSGTHAGSSSLLLSPAIENPIQDKITMEQQAPTSHGVLNLPSDLFPEESPIKQKGIRINEPTAPMTGKKKVDVAAKKLVFSGKRAVSILTDDTTTEEEEDEHDHTPLKKLKSRGKQQAKD